MEDKDTRVIGGKNIARSWVTWTIGSQGKCVRTWARKPITPGSSPGRDLGGIQNNSEGRSALQCSNEVCEIKGPLIAKDDSRSCEKTNEGKCLELITKVRRAERRLPRIIINRWGAVGSSFSTISIIIPFIAIQ